MCFDGKDIIPPLKKVEPNRGFGFGFTFKKGKTKIVFGSTFSKGGKG
jgi:hypothetical protein